MRTNEASRGEVGIRPRLQCPQCRQVVVDVWPVAVGMRIRGHCTQCKNVFTFVATPDRGLVDEARIEPESNDMKKIVDAVARLLQTDD